MPAVFSPVLPPEVWHHIFTDATAPPATAGTEDYKKRLRFQCPHFRLRYSLVLVCKLWRVLALQFLYECVWITHARAALYFQRVLVKSMLQRPLGYGNWVRHLILPTASVNTSKEGVRFVDIIRFCPQLETLTKAHYFGDDDDYFWRGLACTVPYEPGRYLSFGSFASLRYLHWCYSGSRDTNYEDLEAWRLSEIVLHAPNLSFLSIQHFRRPLLGFYPHTHPNTVLCPSLTTLEFRSAFTNTVPFVVRSQDMQNLVHVIALPEALFGFDPATAHLSIIALFGHQLQVIEFMDGGSTNPVTAENIQTIFQHCPKLRKFKYNLECTALRPEFPILHPSLSHITLRTAFDERSDAIVAWRCLRLHFAAFIGKSFPALRCVVLEGDWSWATQDFRFSSWHRSLLARGCLLEHSDGTAVPLRNYCKA